MLAGALPENTRCQWCSTASSACHPGQRALASVVKHLARLCLTASRRRVHNRTVLGDHMPPSHGSGWCLTAGGRRAPLEGALDGTTSRKHSSADAGWWGVVEYQVRVRPLTGKGIDSARIHAWRVA